MTEQEFLKLRKEGRDIIKGVNKRHLYPDYQSDQQLKNPQPPLVKAPMRDTAIDLPLNFDALNANASLLDLANARKSSRVYTQENISWLQLSYLLWVTQGIKEIRGKAYATLRTVPCGGGRHPFETYLFVNHVEGLPQGLYHYLQMGHIYIKSAYLYANRIGQPKLPSYSTGVSYLTVWNGDTESSRTISP